MANQLSTYVEQQLIPVVFKGASCPAAPTGLVLRLYSTAVSDSGGGTELSGNGYAPISLSGLLSAPTISGSDVIVTNTADIISATATGTWATASYWGITDGSANLLAFGAVTSPKTIATGENWACLAGELDITFSGAASTAVKSAVMSWVFAGSTFTPTTVTQFALYDGTDTEISTSGTGYSRQAITLGSVTDNGDGRHYVTNTNAVSLTATGSWGTVAKIGGLTSGGVVITYGATTEAKSYTTGETFSLPISGFKMGIG